MSTFRSLADHSEPLVAHADLAGLPVHDASDLRVGRVFGVLTEAETGLIRFLDVQIDGSERHVLVPVGHARLEEVLGQRRIRLRAATVQDLENVPAYEGEAATPEVARTVAGAYGRTFRGARYYAHPAYDHRGLYAGEHPIFRANEVQPGHAPLEMLSTSDFRVVAGEPDIIGWKVKAGGEASGTVRDLVIDPEAAQVRYIEVDLGDGRQLLPIGYVELDAEEKSVNVAGLTRADLEALPGFDGLPVSRVQETALLAAIDRALDARNPFLRVDFSGREMLA